MDFLDEDGNLFGWVNIVDAFAVILVVLFLVAGVSMLASSGQRQPEPVLTQVVEIRLDGFSADKAAMIAAGPVPTRGIVAVENTSVEQVGETHIVRVRVRLRINTTEDGLPQFNGERLYIGKTLTLDLGDVTIEGRVVDAGPPQEITVTSTFTPTATPTPIPTPTLTPTSSLTSAPTISPTNTSISGETHVIEVRTVLSSDVAASIREGPVATKDVVAIEDKAVRGQGDTVTVTLRVRLHVRTDNGAIFFRGVQLTTGQRLILDLDSITVTGEITAL